MNLSDNYVRPKVTYTETIQNYDKIKSLLKDYIKIEDIDTIPLGTFIKYITYKNGKPQIRIGGILVKAADEYITLRTYNFKFFHVQKYHWAEGANKELDNPVFGTMFWKNKIDKKTIKIEKQQEHIQKQQEQISALITENTLLSEQNKKLTTQLSHIYKDYPELFADQ
tara:strand:+ start:318 stop:821 length:504 start_codon:yes stop_codon:yes gene_type:complete